jgi:hypothetical protein
LFGFATAVCLISRVTSLALKPIDINEFCPSRHISSSKAILYCYV